MYKPVQFAFFIASIISLGLGINNFPLKVRNPGKPLANRFVVVPTAPTPPISLEFLTNQTGLQLVDFQVDRSTFGFLDTDYTLPFDPSLANKKVAIGCDSVNISIRAVIGSTPVGDSLGLRIGYGNPNSTNSPAQIFLFNGGHVQVNHLGINFTCDFPASALAVTSDQQGRKLLDLNLSNCLNTLGLSLQAGDTLHFDGKFQINPNGPFTSDFDILPGLMATGYEQQNGTLVQADTLFDTFRIARTEVVFDFPNTINGLPIGCEEGLLNWKLFVPDNNFPDWFGNELRPSTKVDSLVFNFDPGLLTAFSGGEMEVSIPGHPDHGSNYFGIRPLGDFPNGHYVALFDTLTKVPSLNDVQNYTFDLRLRLRPSCQSPFGSLDNDGIYQIESKIAYTDRYYAKFIGDGSCTNSQSDEATSTVAYNHPPILALTPVTPIGAQVVNGFATWDIQLCNTSSQSDAGTTWLALEDPSGQLNIGAIADISNPNAPVPLSLTTFAQGAFAMAPALAAGECKNFRIVATTATCDDVALNIRTGWNCSSYPPLWTPSLNAPCSSESLQLILLNSDVSPIQLSIDQFQMECSGAGALINISGFLTSNSTLGNDSYLLSFIADENGDSIAQTTEPVLHQIQLTGFISQTSPLPFNDDLDLSAITFCGILIKVESLNSNGCNSFSVPMPIPTLLNAGENRSLCSNQGIYSTILGANWVCDTSNYQFEWTALAPASSLYLSDTSLQHPNLTFDPALHLGQTLNYILETKHFACGFSTFDTVSIVVPAGTNGVFDAGSLNLQATDCQSNTAYCAPIPPLILVNYAFFDNGAPYIGGIANCATGVNLFFSPGIHQLVAIDTVSLCADTILLQINCTNTDTIQVPLLLGQMDTICFSSIELTGNIESLNNICLDGQLVDYQLLNDSCIVILADLVGTETACLVACDANGFCDTTILEILVEHPFEGGINDTITIAQSQVFCFDGLQLNLQGAVASAQNICPSSSGSAVDFSVDSVNYCVNYTGVALGNGLACLEFCDLLGNCDTILYSVLVVPGNIISDTVFLLLETDTFCLPLGILPGTLVGIENICPDQANGEVNFQQFGNCIFYTGLAIGADTACYRFEDEFGNIALYELRVSVRKTTPSIVCDSLFVGESKLFCLDLSELPSDFAEGSIKEICPDQHMGNVELTINETGSCIVYRGVSEGRDSACIVYCDEFGFCDTTYFCFEVKPYFDPPILGPDVDTTLKGTPIVIDFLANDTIFGGIEDIYILTNPLSGNVVLNLDNSFTYIPNENDCAHWDEFEYVACNPNGCDTTTVSIYLQCIELTIFTAVSPNNDDVNDVFFIAKIEEFPDNHLWVYNIWGSLVYEATAYNNTWPGTWGADTDLPDGTYYYILEWKDNGKTTVQKGYIEMFR